MATPQAPEALAQERTGNQTGDGGLGQKPRLGHFTLNHSSSLNSRSFQYLW